MKVHIWSAIFFVGEGIFFIFGIPLYRQVEFGTPDPSKNSLISFFCTQSSAGAAYQIVAPKVFGPPRQAKVPEIPSKVADHPTETNHSVCQNQKKYQKSTKDESPSSDPDLSTDDSPSKQPDLSTDDSPSKQPDLSTDCSPSSDPGITKDASPSSALPWSSEKHSSNSPGIISD